MKKKNAKIFMQPNEKLGCIRGITGILGINKKKELLLMKKNALPL